MDAMTAAAELAAASSASGWPVKLGRPARAGPGNAIATGAAAARRGTAGSALA
jgi:hypothetical protein